MKKILGLDLGTNSIGWALIEHDFDKKQGKILGLGTRIIPMSQDILGDFGKGNSVSQTAERTKFRTARRLRERHLLRRERLHRVLNLVNFLPEHYAAQIDFDKHPGKIKTGAEPKLPYNNGEFLFKASFEEMLADFRQHQPQLVVDEKGEPKSIPYDWTIYFLRKKALSQKIEKEELAWILLNFNQKRGYYQLRGEEEEEKPNKLVELHCLKVVDVIPDPPQRGKPDIWYSLVLENGWVYRRSSKVPLYDWKDKIRDLIVTTDLNDDGSFKKDKEGNVRRSFRSPGEDDWTLRKTKSEKEIDQSGKTVGAYIYDTLLNNPTEKIRGGLIRTIERKFYKDELRMILQNQAAFHPELRDANLLNECAKELYKNNENHQLLLSSRNFVYLFLDDIIFYQRPLRSQKSSISNCTLEYRKYKDSKGIERTQHLKAIAKSNPYYQEFRVWQWLHNLSIYKKDGEKNVTKEFLNTVDDKTRLFDFLNCRKDIEQKTLIKYLLEQKGLNGKLLNAEIDKYRWNYVEDKSYPCNETRALINIRLSRSPQVPNDFLTREREQEFWHLLYSVTDRIEFEKAIRSFARKYRLEEHSFFEAFRKFPPFKNEYGSYSERAIKKLLGLMRVGNYWKWEAVNSKAQERIDKLLNGELDESIDTSIREKIFPLTKQTDFQGLQPWFAQYLVYGSLPSEKWDSADDLEAYLNNFKQHSLRNPIVEQIVTETLRVVKDIWLKYGNGTKDFFNEIHIELGRELKNTAEQRRKITNQVIENENTNLRIKALLAELKNDHNVENVRPFSPIQQEILKVYEEGVLKSNIEIEDDILRISKTSQPTSSELKRYKLWLEQKYRSPYTGRIIPLNKLFTPEYEIEHIIPQSIYFDDSLSNKVICESVVNKLKDNQLGYEFIKNHHGEKIQVGNVTLQILELDAYEDFVRRHYAKNRNKLNRLLLEEVPDKMIERQLNDTRYISKFISSILSNIVRSDTKDDGLNSKNLIPGNGKITAILKQDWGLNDIWNDLILPRFTRLNHISNSTDFTAWNENHQKYLPTIPFEHAKGLSKKRIDHRHHAMDALTIACATRDHVNLLNNQHAKSRARFDLNRKLRRYEKSTYIHPQTGNRIERKVPKDFIKPWDTFTVDAKTALESVVVSFKQNLRIINKATNYYKKWVVKDGIKKQEEYRQDGINWAIRKPLHKDTIFGIVKLRNKKLVSFSNALNSAYDIVDKSLKRHILSMQAKGMDNKEISKFFKDKNNRWNGQDISKTEIYHWESNMVASRVPVTDAFDEKRIQSITDTGIQKILLRHLSNYKEYLNERKNEITASLLAFSAEGIEEMNKNIRTLNDGKLHQPIKKVRTYEYKGNKFNVGNTGNKSKKYVEAAKGTNLFFAIYCDSTGNRSYESIPLDLVVERQKQRMSSVPEKNKDDYHLLFHLSPNDLVYVPGVEETENHSTINLNSPTKYQIRRIYRMVSCTEGECHFVPATYASPVRNNECGSNNKNERMLQYFDDEDFLKENSRGKAKPLMIKDYCVKLTVDRLGNVKVVHGYM